MGGPIKADRAPDSERSRRALALVGRPIKADRAPDSARRRRALALVGRPKKRKSTSNNNPAFSWHS